MTIVNAAGRAMTDVTDDSQLCDVTDDQKPPGTRSYLTVGLPDPHPVRNDAIFSVPVEAIVEFPGDRSTCTNFDEKKVFLGLNKNSKTYSLSNRLSTFQTLDLAGHARILITVGPAIKLGYETLNDRSKNGRESISA